MSVTDAQGTHTLIVRLWRERGERGERVWRGSLDHVQSGQRYYFQTLAGLQEQVARLVGMMPAAGPEDEEVKEGT